MASSFGTSATVAMFAVTSSPVTPSPRVAACTNRPRSYVSDMATPSTLGSQEKASVSRSMSGACRFSRSPQARSSSSLNALSRLIMGTRWRTSWNRPDGAAPTVCVGESGVASDG